MSMCLQLATGRTKYSMSRYDKDEIAGHLLKHKVCLQFTFSFY